MKLIILLLAILSVEALADKQCTGVYFNNEYYDVEVIKEKLNKIHNLAINNNDNTVYFTFEYIDTEPNKVLGYINLDTRIFGVIAGIKNASSIAVDQINSIVYVGGSRGLFLLNENKEPELLPVYNSTKSLFFKNVLYYTNESKAVSKFCNLNSIALKELEGVLAEDFALDDDNNIFFLQNDTKLFRMKLDTRALNSYEMYTVNYVTTDVHYRPFILTDNGVFMYNKNKCVFDKVFNMNNLKALTFGKTNEPIYVVHDMLVRLKLNPVPCN